MDKSSNTDLTQRELQELVEKLPVLENNIRTLKEECDHMRFRLANISHDEKIITFYTGFPSFETLKACFEYLGPAVNHLSYKERNETDVSRSGRPHILLPMEEFFLVLVRLRLGLMEQDIAYRFNISQSTVSRIIITWINFMYLQFEELPLWPKKEVVTSYMPQTFKEQYPSTRVIINATEIFIEQPRLPEIQKMTFSSYKNHNTYKALIRISPSGAITFVSKLFSGSISDKELTRQSGLLDLLDAWDSVMADKGFDIAEYLIPRGVQLNIPPFLRGTDQFSHKQLVENRRIASLRIHVERAMERIKNFHIFDRVLPASLTEIADRMFFVCCILCNFHAPLCT